MDPTPVDRRLHTRFCDLVGVRYPIVQTGMGWVAGSRLTAATARAGGPAVGQCSAVQQVPWNKNSEFPL